MIRIYLAAVDVVPAAIVLLPLFWMLNFVCYHRNHWKSILYCLFCLYLSAVFSLVGIPNVTNFRPDVNWNLIPFRGMVNDLKNSFMNIVLLFPWDAFCRCFGHGLERLAQRFYLVLVFPDDRAFADVDLSSY